MTFTATTETTQDTIGGYMKRWGIDDYPTVQGLIRFLKSQGQAKEGGHVPTATGKGKPSTIWLIPAKVEINFIGEKNVAA